MRASTSVRAGWTRGAHARRPNRGKTKYLSCAVDDPRAEQWSLLGAMLRARLDGEFIASVEKVLAYIPGADIEKWQDHRDRTKEEVLAVLRKCGM